MEYDINGSMNGNKQNQCDYVNGDRCDYNGKHPDHAFFEFTFRRFFDDGGQPYPIRLNDIERAFGSTAHHRAATSDNTQSSPVYV